MCLLSSEEIEAIHGRRNEFETPVQAWILARRPAGIGS
jgi:hypothetical protein